MVANRRPSRSISDVTKFDCQCGHDDCENILKKKAIAMARRKESLLPSLRETAQKRTSDASKSPLPALFRKLSLAGNNEENEAKRYGKVRKIFFSPHPDDVAYSCFGLASGKRVNSTYRQGSSRHSSNSSNSYCSAGSFNTDSTLDSSTTIEDGSHGNIEHSTLFSDLDITGPNFETLSTNSDTWIVTIFSKSRCANGQIGQSLNHCVNATTSLRQREDEEFAQSIGARLISLGLRDTSARDESSRHPELLANTRNSLSNLSVNHPSFEYMKEQVRPFVEWAIECKADIHIPVAVGCHIDHWMVRVAILSILYQIEQERRWLEWRTTHSERTIDRDESNTEIQKQDLLRRFSASHRMDSVRFGSQLIFYEDLPYAFLGSDDLIERTVTHFLPSQVRTALIPMTESDWTRKKLAVKGYASQMKPTLLDMLHDHAMLLAKRASILDPSWNSASTTTTTNEWSKAERCWILDDVCGLKGTLLTAKEQRRQSIRNEWEETTIMHSETNEEEKEEKPIINSPLPKVKFLSPFDHATQNDHKSYQPLTIHSPSSKTLILDQFSDPISNLPLSPTSRKSIRPIKAFQRVSTCPPDAFPIAKHG